MISKDDNVKDLREQCLQLFSSKNIFYNCGADLIDKYKQIYNNNSIKKLLADEETVNTVVLFYNNNLNISIASKVGYMHRNTLIYRLDKIYNSIGLDVRNFNDAVVFENLLLFYNLIKRDLY
jgi:sugar diacid utilization regulator